MRSLFAVPSVTPFRQTLLSFAVAVISGVRHFRASENQQWRERGTGCRNMTGLVQKVATE
jgi:hypothetical protein